MKPVPEKQSVRLSGPSVECAGKSSGHIFDGRLGGRCRRCGMSSREILSADEWLSEIVKHAKRQKDLEAFAREMENV